MSYLYQYDCRVLRTVDIPNEPKAGLCSHFFHTKKVFLKREVISTLLNTGVKRQSTATLRVLGIKKIPIPVHGFHTRNWYVMHYVLADQHQIQKHSERLQIFKFLRVIVMFEHLHMFGK